MNIKSKFFTILILFFLIFDSLGFAFVNEGFITVSTNTPFEPWEFKSGEEIIGVDIDISKRIAEKLNLKLKINDVSFDALVLEIVNKKCDFAVAAMSESEEKKKSIDFSDPYFRANQSIIVKQNSNISKTSDLQGKKIGVQMGTTGHNYCSSHYNVSTYSSAIDAVMDLINGSIDAVVIDELPAKKLTQKNNGKIKVLDEVLFSEDYRIALPKGNLELKKIINEVLSEIKSEGFVQKKIEEYSKIKEEESLGFLDQIRVNLIDKERYKQILNGLAITFRITIFSLIIGVLLGYITAFVILAKDKSWILKFLKVVAKIYVSIIRGTPIVCQLFIIYYLILSPLGADKVLCATIAFGINSGAYVSEIIRSGILSVDSGQVEAGKALGLKDNQIMWSIIAPQALKNSLATLCNEFMQLIKETSVAGFIGVTELTRSGEIIRSQTLSPFVPLITVALIYLVIVHLLGILMSFFERKLRRSDKS